MDQSIVLVSIFLLIASSLSPSLGQSNAALEECKRDFGCVDIQPNILPFCGHPGFKLGCVNNDHYVINIDGIEHRIMSVDKDSHSLTIARTDLWNDICLPKKKNSSSLDQSSSFAYGIKATNLTLAYNCSDFRDRRLNSYPKSFICPVGGIRNFYFNDTFLNLVLDEVSERCSGGILKVRVDRDILYQIENSRVSFAEGLNRGFPLNYMNFGLCDQCRATRGGVCGFNTTAQFRCSFPIQSHNSSQRQVESHALHRGGNQKVKVIIGIIVGGIGILLIFVTLCCCKIIKPRNFLLYFMREDQDIEAFIHRNGCQTTKRYRFFDVKKMTKSFKDKLGQGGFGNVYKGKLSDDRLVAVKLLNSSKGNGEDFINEVASISRTSHVNIVKLLGFCLEGGKRALIYEFMSNGSLEKFLFSDNTSQKHPNLEWDKVIQIATGIARGLEYLHRGCNTRILHFDIKPHNILLDEDLCPKISDFGLAKLLPNNKQSNISLLDARGTTGYIAPEVFNRNFGVVSPKSDVYSYGMMILEMVSGRKNINAGASRTSEIYFPDWVYKHLEDGSKFKIWDDMTTGENGIARKMVLVGLWCIQIAPSNRPSMTKVIEMLEGSVEALQIPPKPTVFTHPVSIEEE